MHDQTVSATGWGCGYGCTLISAAFAFLNANAPGVGAVCAILGTIATIYFGYRTLALREKEIKSPKVGVERRKKSRRKIDN